MKKLFLILSFVLAVTMVLSACAPTPTPAPVVTTVPPTKAPTAVPPTAAPTVTPTVVPTPVPTPIPPICTKLSDAPAVLPAAGQLGAADKPITMAFVPSGDAGIIATASSAIADCLNKMTGLFYTVQTGTSYAAAIEAMGGGKAQVGFLNTFSILLAQAKYGIIPALVNLRNYQTNDLDPDKALKGQLEPFYKAEFLASASSGIKTFADLKGKTFCFVDPLSTSGYIVPYYIILPAHGINPVTDFKATINAGSHQKVAIGIYNGDCDAGVAYIDILLDKPTLATYPDLATKVTVFAVSDRIPNDGVQYVKTLDPKLQAITTEALLAMAADPGGKQVLAKLYTINAFEKIDVAPTIYSDFAKVLIAAGVDPSALIK